MSSIPPGGGRCVQILERSEKTCPCRQYQDPDDPPPGQPVGCRECTHGKSLHIGGGFSDIFNNQVTSMVRDMNGQARQTAYGEAVKHWSSGSKGASSSGSKHTTSTTKVDTKKVLSFDTPLACHRETYIQYRKRKQKAHPTLKPIVEEGG